MFSPDNQPFRCGVRMVPEHMGLKGKQLGRQELKAKTELSGALDLTLPAVMRINRAVDLHADGQILGNDPRRQGFSLGPVRERGPCD